MIKSLVGKNSYDIGQELAKIKSEYIKTRGEMSVEQIDCAESEPEFIKFAIGSVSLFSRDKLVILKNLRANNQAAGDIEEILKLAETGNETVLVEPDIDKRSSYYKTLKAKTKLQEFPERNENDLSAWAVERARELKAKISHQDARYLIERVGTEQNQLNSELKKLADYDQQITKRTIELLCEPSPQSSIFELIDAAFSGNAKRTLELYQDQRAQGTEPQRIFGMLVWQIHLIATARAGYNISPDEVAAKTGVKKFSFNKAKSIVKRIGPIGVDKLIELATKADKDMKRSSHGPDEIMKNLLLNLSLRI